MHTHTHVHSHIHMENAHRYIVIDTIRSPTLHTEVSEVEPHLFVGRDEDGPPAVQAVLITPISIGIK